jgi:signal transduction histidine kinase
MPCGCTAHISTTLTGDGIVKADARALESVLTNLVQNAVIHGQATRVDIQVQRVSGRLQVRVGDNGGGFQGDPSRLGELFVRHERSSGSGVGLYIVRRLVTSMNGTIKLSQRR